MEKRTINQSLTRRVIDPSQPDIKCTYEFAVYRGSLTMQAKWHELQDEVQVKAYGIIIVQHVEHIGKRTETMQFDTGLIATRANEITGILVRLYKDKNLTTMDEIQTAIDYEQDYFYSSFEKEAVTALKKKHGLVNFDPLSKPKNHLELYMGGKKKRRR